MRNNPMVFVSSLDRHFDKTQYKSVETGQREESGPAAFPAPSFPSASMFLNLGMTKGGGKDPKDSRKSSVSLYLPFEQGLHEETYEKAYTWVSGLLLKIHKGDWSYFDTVQPLVVAPVGLIPIGVPVPVMVGFTHGTTIHLGNFQFSTVDLSLNVLADPDRAVEAHKFVVEFVRGKVEAMETSVRKYLAGRAS